MERAWQASFLMVVGGILFGLGSFLDWATAGGFGATGMDGGDGWYTLIAGAVLAVVGILAYREDVQVLAWVGWVAWFVATAVAVINVFDILGEDVIELSLGMGMYIMLAGGILGLLGLVWARPPTTTRRPPPR